METLVSEFRILNPIPKNTPTIFEVSGYPHFEDVASNVLQFFFQSTHDHGLSSLMVQSLLNTVESLNKDGTSSDYSVLDVEREVVTDKGNRIDLVIETETKCIAIENKLFAILNNDLQDYQKFIKDSYPDKERIYLVLSLQPKRKPDNWDKLKFTEILYEDLLNNIEGYLDKVTPQDEKVQIYLTDFIKTIRNLSKGTELTMGFLEYLQEYKSEIELLHKYAFVDFKNEIKKKGDIIRDNIKLEENGFNSFHLNKPHSLEYVQGFEKVISDGNSRFKLQIKVRLQPKEYRVELWVGDESHLGAFNNFIKSRIEKYNTLESHPENNAGKIYEEVKVTGDSNSISKIIGDVNDLMQKFL
ncbi:PD-(D/E)XK nuclease family protein [Fodinibius roseus]|uniref:PD-(D/E)XK nuclease family protein n=1 Tax=Fodinibius roseus TaxID=1194090 RepID=UPI001B8C024E|nr:PD-(D/E)XK nuclease family protein [Fodinibius roseus]